jgi:glycosyltransferase involved in cell wall biosynthesis
VTGYVWQHHELFHTAGNELSRRYGVPLIEYVHAPVVWEARRWGVRRPGSARFLERCGERPQFLEADLVACVTEEVRREVLRFGVPEERTMVAPMGVDLDRFSPQVDGEDWRPITRAVGDVVLGWAGSVRRFHNLDLAIGAICELRSEGASVGLAVAGDGQDRPRLEALVAELGAREWVRFVGQVPNSAMPGFLASVDIAVLTAGGDQEFHYSPLKLREYLAMGLPVIVPRVGEMTRLIDDGSTGVLYEPGDVKGLATAVGLLAGDNEMRRRLGDAGRSLIAASGSWDAISRRCLDKLEITSAT